MLFTRTQVKDHRRLTVVGHKAGEESCSVIHFGPRTTVSDIFEVLEEEFENGPFSYACFISSDSNKKGLSKRSNSMAGKVADSLLRLDAMTVSRKDEIKE